MSLEMKKQWGMGAMVAIPLIGLAAAFFITGRKPATPPPQPAAQAPAPDPFLNLPATLQPVSIVPVRTPVAGRIESFQVEVGDEVYEGQLLAQIRSLTLETAKLEAETDLENSANRVRNLESSLSAAKLEASRASADSSRVRNDFQRAGKLYQREKMLLAEGATPRRTFEKAEKEYIALEAESANLEAVASAAEERVSTTQRDLDAARKLLQNRAEDLEEADHRIGAGEITAPVTGVIVARRGVAGDEVQPGVADLFQIASDLSVMHAVADLSPSQATGLKTGDPAAVILVEMGGDPLPGSIVRLEPGKLTVEFANPNPLIRPGLTARIRIKLP